MDPTLQNIIADKSARDQQENSKGAGAALNPYLAILMKGVTPSVPQIPASLNIGGQWMDNGGLLPKGRDYLNSRIMPGLFSSKNPPPKGPGGIDPQFLTGGNAIMSAGYEMGDPFKDFQGRGAGLALTAMQVQADPVESGQLTPPTIDAGRLGGSMADMGMPA